MELIQIAGNCRATARLMRVWVERVNQTESDNEQHTDEGQCICVFARHAAKALLDSDVLGCLTCFCSRCSTAINRVSPAES